MLITTIPKWIDLVCSWILVLRLWGIHTWAYAYTNILTGVVECFYGHMDCQQWCRSPWQKFHACVPQATTFINATPIGYDRLLHGATGLYREQREMCKCKANSIVKIIVFDLHVYPFFLIKQHNFQTFIVRGHLFLEWRMLRLPWRTMQCAGMPMVSLCNQDWRQALKKIPRLANLTCTYWWFPSIIWNLTSNNRWFNFNRTCETEKFAVTWVWDTTARS